MRRLTRHDCWKGSAVDIVLNVVLVLRSLWWSSPLVILCGCRRSEVRGYGMRVCRFAKHAECEVIDEYGSCDDEDNEDLQPYEFHVPKYMKNIRAIRHTMAL